MKRGLLLNAAGSDRGSIEISVVPTSLDVGHRLTHAHQVDFRDHQALAANAERLHRKNEQALVRRGGRVGMAKQNASIS